MYNVLYTDDEPDLLEIGKAFLESTGPFTVHTAVSAHVALDLMTEQQIDCVVSDYQMPVMNGIAFLKDLRNRGEEVPFILFTGRGREEVVIEALNNGADFYLQKGGAPAAQFAELSHKIRLAIENRRTLKALQESEEMYRRILENLQDAYIRVGADGIITMVNPSAARMYGYGSTEEMIGIPAASLYTEGDLGRAEALRKAGEAEGIIDLSGGGLRKDGSTFAASLNIQFIRDETGRIIGTEAIIRDVTDRKKREDELRGAYEQIAASEEELRANIDEIVRAEAEREKSEKNFRILVDSAPDAIFTQIEDRFQYVNDAAVRLLGADSAGQLVGTSIWERIHPSCHEDIRSRSDILTVECRAVGHMDEVYVRMDGSTVDVEATAVPYTHEGRRGALVMLRDITERKKNENELRAAYEQITAAEEELRQQYDEVVTAERMVRESREKLQTFMDSATDAFSIYDNNLNLVDLNRTALSYSPPGTKKEDLIGRNLSEFLYGSGDWSDLDTFREVIRTGIPFSGDRKFFESGSGRRWLNVKVFRVGTGLGLMTTDITSQREAEEELRLLKISVDEAYDEVFWLDFEGNILYVNDAACRTTGYTKEEFSDMKISRLDPNYSPEGWDGSVADLREKKRQYFTTRHRCKDGTIIDVEISAVYVNRDGREYSFAFARDITERKRAEEKLREDEREFRHIIENMQDAYILADDKGIITMVNPSAARMFGYGSAEEMAGISAETLYLHAGDRQELIRILQEAGGITNFSGDTVRKDGTTFPVSINVQLVRDNTGRFIRTEAIVRDMSDWKQRPTQTGK